MKNYSFDDLQDKVCVITGGGGVLGTAMAKAIAGIGAKVAIIVRSQASADKAVAAVTEATGGIAIGIPSDVLDKDALAQAKTKINQELGPVDILINCAGGNDPGGTSQVEMMQPSDLDDLEKTFFGMKLEGFQHVFDLNVMGTLLPTMVFAADMLDRKKGVVLNVSSMSAFKPLTKVSAYSAAKASINNLTEWLATHFAKVNIRVNAIAPGFFLTNQNRFLLTDEQTGELTARGKKIIDGTPMGRFGDPEELCGTVLYLLSDLSAFVTGVVLPIDGGFNAYPGV